MRNAADMVKFMRDGGEDRMVGFLWPSAAGARRRLRIQWAAARVFFNTAPHVAPAAGDVEGAAVPHSAASCGQI